ncbi:hypothetical protein B0J17DRAFT_647520 [Rhizoctonia solani]|nr:hypothetical protein B0J17DRAFT_647520 [Rhizoctonia solani]
MLPRCHRSLLNTSRCIPNRTANKPRLYSSLADKYHPKVSLLPFTNDVLTVQAKLELLVPPMFGLAAAIKGYGQMIFGKDVVDSGIKRTNFKAVYIPTWKVDCMASFTSDLGDSDHPTVMHLREATVPGVNHHPLARWVKSFPTDVDDASPFSKDHLEPLNGTYDILTLPFMTAPSAIPQALKEAPYGDIEITEGWSIDPRSVEFQMLVAYPLLHPAFLAEYTLGDKHITVLAHGYHDYFSVWGHTSHPGVWVNAEQGATVTYLRATKPIVGGPAAMPDFLDEENTQSNLDRIAQEPDMNVSDHTSLYVLAHMVSVRIYEFSRSHQRTRQGIG